MGALIMERKLLLVAFIASLAAGQVIEYNTIYCGGAKTCEECMMGVELLSGGTNKCIPIKPPSGKPDLTCANWLNVQLFKYDIDYQCNNAAIPSAEQSQIHDLRFFVKWAFYSYDPSNLLADQKVYANSTLDTQVVMGYDSVSNSIITSFRGSSNIMNWIDDFHFIPVDYNRPGCEKCQVHSGFMDSYLSLYDSIMGYLPQLIRKYPNAQMIVTGHSLGAAQAALCAVDYELMGLNVRLFTYGQPRVGDLNYADFEDALVSNTYMRAVFLNDPVPDLPPAHMGFVHGGVEIHFYTCDDYLADPAFADDKQPFNVADADDHHKYPCTKQSWEAKNAWAI